MHEMMKIPNLNLFISSLSDTVQGQCSLTFCVYDGLGIRSASMSTETKLVKEMKVEATQNPKLV
jgi:hypothetical protein